MTAYSARPQGSRRADFLTEHAQLFSIAAFFLAVFVYFSVASDAFLSAANLLNLVRQAAPMLIVAVAMTFVITTAASTSRSGRSLRWSTRSWRSRSNTGGRGPRRGWPCSPSAP